MATEKTTKKENFQAIVTILEGVNRQDLADVIRHEIELLENKAAKRKPSKSQVKKIKKILKKPWQIKINVL